MVRLINFRAEDEIETALLASISSGKFNDAQEFLEHLIKTSPVRIKCALLSLKALKFGIYSYFVEKMNDVEAAGNLKEEASNLY